MFRRSLQFAVLILCIAAACFTEIPRFLDQHFNKLVKKSPYSASDRAFDLHKQLTIIDLHADSLLWGRDLLERGQDGQVDIPRLSDGNVTLQVFSLPTKTPRGLNIESNDDKTDSIYWLAIVDRWPPRTWNSLTERALYQAKRLHDFARGSEGGFTVIETSADLFSYLQRRQRNNRLTAGLLSIEGAHALDGKLENLDVLYHAGYRMMSPSHFFDNDIGGSSAGVHKTGLTEKGREWVRQMEARHMIIDLAHASPQTIEDVLAIATRPIVVSHTGVKGTCNNNRNLSDDQIQAIAAKGGLIGIGYWDVATCGTDARAIVKAMRYVSDRVGVEHVTLGSDFDGAVTEPFDTTGLVLITDAMLEAGYSESDIRLIMGENALKFLESNLPEK
ncbi:MAG TPA: dipeptidase [Terriglobales bacterium]|nr:dipeptidase [Terriglobales bacterium]